MAMKAELEGLRVTQLLQRARVEGVDDQSLEDAQDSDTPKETLVGLLMNRMLSRGAAECMASTLERGGEACAELISSVLDHAMGVLEALSLSSPRKSRKDLCEMMDRVESMLEQVTADWCGGRGSTHEWHTERALAPLPQRRTLTPRLRVVSIHGHRSIHTDRCRAVNRERE